MVGTYIYKFFLLNEFSFLGKDPSLLSHSPHITSTGHSALIPFCAYKTDMNFSQNPLSLPGITFPFCSSFLPTLLDGHLCYKLTLDKKSGQGKKNALMLVLDYNEDHSVSSTKGTMLTSSKKLFNYDEELEKKQRESARIHIDFLAPFDGLGGGLYLMTAVKKMTSKEDFLSMDFKDRQCDIELYENCRTRELVKHCNCVPWEVSGFEVRGRAHIT